MITELALDLGNRLLEAQKTKQKKKTLVLTKCQEKAAMTPQEIEPDLPVCVQDSPGEAWASSGLLQGRGP